MLAIRLQRGGRKGHPHYRVLVQDSRLSPTSGKYAAQLGTYDPHSKQLVVDKEAAGKYLSNGAQPSDRVALLFAANGIELPKWVKMPTQKSSKTRNPDKLRKNRPAEEAAEETPATETSPQAEEPAEEAPAAPVAAEAETTEESA